MVHIITTALCKLNFLAKEFDFLSHLREIPSEALAERQCAVCNMA